MSFDPTSLLIPSSTAVKDIIDTQRLPGDSWVPILHHACDFGSDVFQQVSINLIRNPNINSSHLFRADILYDSHNDEHTNVRWPSNELERLLQESKLEDAAYPRYKLKRTMIRRMIPRNPQLDKPVAQSCYILEAKESTGIERNLVIYRPHVSDPESLPWYHPTVQAVAFVHTLQPQSEITPPGTLPSKLGQQKGSITIQYQLFLAQTLPLNDRVLRTAHHLLSTLHKHGQGCLAGYTKRVHHDQLISQQRVQDMYTDLKKTHAKRLCDAWVEQTEPSKHVFEDLGIAAFLLELWKDMYRPINAPDFHPLPPFPGFVDIGCGNGVLTEVLLAAGYSGWGFDARRRKTWAVLSPPTRNNLHELLLIPQPLFDLHPTPPPTTGLIARTFANLFPAPHPLAPAGGLAFHNGLFPAHTFIISNHADELTAWTPLLAALSMSPFLIIPCCSHNLSGERFRAPSVFNSLSADAAAPTFFEKDVKKAKSVAIASVASDSLFDSDDPDHDTESQVRVPHTPHGLTPTAPHYPPNGSETGDLKLLTPAARAKQPSAYSSLCDWVTHLAGEVGYTVKREMLRIPSTRNVGIVGKGWRDGDLRAGKEGDEERKERVMRIVRREGADGRAWVRRGMRLRGEGRKRKVEEGFPVVGQH